MLSGNTLERTGKCLQNLWSSMFCSTFVLTNSASRGRYSDQPVSPVPEPESPRSHPVPIPKPGAKGGPIWKPLMMDPEEVCHLDFVF